MAWQYLPLSADNQYNDNLAVTNQNFEQLRNFLGKRSLTISKTGIATVNVPNPSTGGTDYSTNVTHNFNYVPGAFVMVKSVTDSKWYPVSHNFTTWTAPNYLTKCRCWFKIDTTTLTLYVSPDGTATYEGDWQFRYYIFEEDIT